MKKLIVGALFAAFLAGRFSQELDVNAQGGQGLAAVAGIGGGATAGPCDADPTQYSLDTNDDGGVDLSDFVYGLSWFFSGAEAPRVCLGADLAQCRADLIARQNQVAALQMQLTTCQADRTAAQNQVTSLQTQLTTCQADLESVQATLDDCLIGTCPLPKLLPDTGQNLCYNESGNVIACTSATCAGQDGSYETGCANDGSRFDDNSDGTVTDNCTGLMWQQDTGNGGVKLTWCAALEHCDNLVFAGRDDWRLPSVRELRSIVDFGRFSPAIDPVFSTFNLFYWSSTPYSFTTSSSWLVGFGDGDSERSIGTTFNIRAVRTVP